MTELKSSMSQILDDIMNDMALNSRRKNKIVTLIAVSKKQSKYSIIEAYNCGVRHFGENYVDEFLDKSNDPEIKHLCPEINWHFIGHLQRNKVSKLINGVPNLAMIHSIDSIKLAETVNNSFDRTLNKKEDHLRVLIQVNTSGEESKSGIPIEDVEDLYLFINRNCPLLLLDGLMTIGSPNHDLTKGPNPDFVALVDLKKKIEDKYGEELRLSMGMSQDFCHAIELGSSYVRIGEKIFGKRK